MFEKIVQDKAAYLKENYPFYPIPKLTAHRLCIHCDKVILVGDFKVFVGHDRFEYICCPNAPQCSGTVIDWVDPPRGQRGAPAAQDFRGISPTESN